MSAKISSAELCKLHRIHRQLAELRSRLSRGPRQIAAAEANLKTREDELAQAKETVTRSRVAVDQKELQLKEREGDIADVHYRENGQAPDTRS